MNCCKCGKKVVGGVIKLQETGEEKIWCYTCVDEKKKAEKKAGKRGKRVNTVTIPKEFYKLAKAVATPVPKEGGLISVIISGFSKVITVRDLRDDSEMQYGNAGFIGCERIDVEYDYMYFMALMPSEFIPRNGRKLSEILSSHNPDIVISKSIFLMGICNDIHD